jgi:D-alanyl-D-alanine carboxypeptidase (penicillin-binding protein 5/6)
MNAKENGKSTEAARFSQTKKILDYAFSHFQLKEVVPANGEIKGHETIDVAKGKSKEASVSPKNSVKIITEKGQKDHTKINFKLNYKVMNDQKVVAPIKKGETVAYVSATNSNLKDLGYVGGQTTDSMTPVVTNVSIEKAGWFSLAIRSIGNFFSDIWMNAANTVNNWF